MPRSQSAHAIVHSGFLYKLTPNNTVITARIVYGGLSPSFIRAEATERFLVGKPLFSNSTLQAALNILETELVVVESPPEASVKYRKQLSLSLFYKVNLLSITIRIFNYESVQNCSFTSGTAITLSKRHTQSKIYFWNHKDT